MRYRDFITNVTLMAVTIAWVYPFYNILRYGTHTVQEPNLTILILEIVMFIGIIAFAIANIISSIRRGKHDKR